MNGSEFLKDMGFDLSELGARVADFLSVWYGGMHNFLHQTNLEKTDWCNDHHIAVIFHPGGRMATYDADLLTRLVVLSHGDDWMLRVEVNPKNFQYLELVFHQRKQREGSLMHRLPTMTEHLKMIRGEWK